jgi:hypothetical protein
LGKVDFSEPAPAGNESRVSWTTWRQWLSASAVCP